MLQFDFTVKKNLFYHFRSNSVLLRIASLAINWQLELQIYFLNNLFPIWYFKNESKEAYDDTILLFIVNSSTFLMEWALEKESDHVFFFKWLIL
jgi:hypothetical protein